jgi:hydrogenase maturation protein HypF
MENEETLEHFEATIALYRKMFRIKPELLACDMHPDYLATKWAEARAEAENLPLVRVQHHHAHIASCMVENGIESPVIGASFDGTGYGTDGRIWGGEFMVCDYNGFKRQGHLEYLPLPGGSAAIKRPYRTAIGYLYRLLGKEALSAKLPFLKTIDENTPEIIMQQVDRGLNSPLTSSCGRLFDAVSALIGVRGEINYDAQAAIELEMAAGGTSVEGNYPFTIDFQEGMSLIRLKELFEAIITDMNAGAPTAVISARFHNTISRMIVRMCRQLAEENSLNTVAISGGVFQNRRLLEQASKELKAAGLKVISQSRVPSNDGGVALGQVVIASMTRRS